MTNKKSEIKDMSMDQLRNGLRSKNLNHVSSIVKEILERENQCSDLVDRLDVFLKSNNKELVKNCTLYCEYFKIKC